MSFAPGVSFRLGNQVVLVQGKHADALYDLRSRRIRRLSKPASALVQAETAGESRAADFDARERGFLAQLAAQGLLEPRRATRVAPYSGDWQWPTALPPLRTISFELDERSDERRLARISAWIAEAIADFGLLSLVLVVAPCGVAAAERIASEAMARCDDLVVETLVTADPDPASPAHTQEPRRHRLEVVADGEAVGLGADGRRRVRGAAQAIGPEAFIVSFAFFHLLNKFGESHGCLHFDSDLRAFPDIAESHYCLSADSGESRPLRELLDDDQLRHYWSRSKREREKCRDCELRFACPNPVAARSQLQDLDSAPANCSYALDTGTWRPPT